MPRLYVLPESPGDEPLELADRYVMVGREAECPLQIEDANVSKHHALLLKSEETYQVFDLHSANGTYVNDARVNHATLKDGDVLRFGPATFRFETRPLVRKPGLKPQPTPVAGARQGKTPIAVPPPIPGVAMPVAATAAPPVVAAAPRPHGGLPVALPVAQEPRPTAPAAPRTQPPVPAPVPVAAPPPPPLPAVPVTAAPPRPLFRKPPPPPPEAKEPEPTPAVPLKARPLGKAPAPAAAPPPPPVTAAPARPLFRKPAISTPAPTDAKETQGNEAVSAPPAVELAQEQVPTPAVPEELPPGDEIPRERTLRLKPAGGGGARLKLKR